MSRPLYSMIPMFTKVDKSRHPLTKCIFKVPNLPSKSFPLVVAVMMSCPHTNHIVMGCPHGFDWMEKDESTISMCLSFTTHKMMYNFAFLHTFWLSCLSKTSQP